MTGGIVKVKRGPGRPRADQIEYTWDQVPFNAPCVVSGERGTYYFRYMSDRGASVTVWGGPMGQFRTFVKDRITVEKMETPEKMPY
jgi:hypothetical protein